MHPFTAHSGLQNVKKEQFTIMSLISLLKTIFVNKYLPIYDDNFVVKILRDDCALKG